VAFYCCQRSRNLLYYARVELSESARSELRLLVQRIEDRVATLQS